MRNSTYFWVRGNRKKAKEEVISERRREEVTWWKNMGTGLRSGTARFLMGSLPSAPWEVRSSALQSHQGHHLLQLEGQPLFPGSIILLQRTHDLPQWGKRAQDKKTTVSALKPKGSRLLKATAVAACLLLLKISKCKKLPYNTVEIGNIFVTSWLFCLQDSFKIQMNPD